MKPFPDRGADLQPIMVTTHAERRFLDRSGRPTPLLDRLASAHLVGTTKPRLKAGPFPGVPLGRYVHGAMEFLVAAPDEDDAPFAVITVKKRRPRGQLGDAGGWRRGRPARAPLPDPDDEE